MKWTWIVRLTILVLFPLFLTQAQMSPPNPSVPAACPIQFLSLNPSVISVRVQNISGKQIVGLVFNVALADATEHWKWLHWDFDSSRDLHDFSWNKTLKPGASKSLTRYRSDPDFEHGGGGAFVLTRVLFDDGSGWEASAGNTSCKYLWYNSHKKVFLRPVDLPPRD